MALAQLNAGTTFEIPNSKLIFELSSYWKIDLQQKLTDLLVTRQIREN